MKAEDFRPLGSWVLVQADPRVKKTKGGIELPDMMTKVERVMEGTGKVLRVGPKVMKSINLGLETGMRIAYRGFLKDATSPLFEKIDDCEVFLLAADDVLAVVDEGVQLGAFS